MVFFAGAAFFTAGRDAAGVFFLGAVTVFFLAAVARGAFFAALFFAFGTAVAMNLLHDGLFPAEDREETALLEHSECPLIYVMDDTILNGVIPAEEPPVVVHNPIFNTPERLH